MLRACTRLAFVWMPLAVAAQTPVIQEGGVVNAAAAAAGTPVSPGSLVFITGSELAAGLARADSVPLSTSLAEVTVSFNDIPAPLHLVSANQISAQVPWNALADGVDSGAVSVVVRRSGAASEVRTVQLQKFAPAVFAFVSGSILQAIAVNADDATLAQPAGSIPGIKCSPSRAGRALVIYATGLGPVTPSIESGRMPGDVQRTTVTTPVVLIGGREAAVQFSGLAPDSVGVNQINVTVPDSVPAGLAVPVQIRMGDITTTDRVTIAVAN